MLDSDDVSPDQIWLLRNRQFRKCSTKSHVLIIWAIAVTFTLKIATTKCLHNSGSWCCITIPNLVTKCSMIQKISSAHSLTFWTFIVTLTLKTVIPLFHRTILLMMLYYQTKFGCKPTSSLEATTEIVIVWLYKPSLWPWHWTQWTNFSAQHFGLWCCITIPGLATIC